MHALCSNPMVSNNFAKLCFTQIHLMVVHMFHFWNFSSPRDYFLSLYMDVQCIPFHLDFILLVHLDRHTSGLSRPSYFRFMQNFHTSGSSRFFHNSGSSRPSYFWNIQSFHTSGSSRVFIPLVRLDFIRKPGSSKNSSYFWLQKHENSS